MPTTRRHLYALLLASASALLLNGCGSLAGRDSGPSYSMDTSGVADAVPKTEPRSKYGNPDSYVVNGTRYAVMDSAAGYSERGIASWYGNKFHGQRTSSGETYDMYGMTAAHTRLPLPTYVRVTNLQNGRSTVVKVNDRGPFHDNRLIDLSYAAASKLGIVETGTGLVEVQALTPGQPAPAPVSVARTSPADIGGSAAARQVQLYLQVGAFVSRSNAEQLRERLNRENLPPVVIQQTTNAANTPIYRVRVGPIANVDEADRLATQLGSYGLGSPNVVID